MKEHMITHIDNRVSMSHQLRHVIASLLLTLLVAPFTLLSAQDKLSGDEAYSNGNYAEAIKIYEELISQQGHASAELYYNLGCAYFKNNEPARAILNFERAYRLDPSDGDIRYNLELANTKTVDKMDATQELIVTRWANAISHWFGYTTWLTIGILLFVVLLVGALIYMLHPKREYRVVGFYSGVAALLISIFCNIMAYRSHLLSHDDSKAILMAEVITVKSSPDRSAEDIVVVHAGMKVTINQTLNGYAEVVLPDGTVGWVAEDQLEVINKNL